jgi:hypothetical protein
MSVWLQGVYLRLVSDQSQAERLDLEKAGTESLISRHERRRCLIQS